MYSIYDNLPSLDDIRRAHEQGRVIISRHDDYLVAKYSQQTVISGDWDNLTMSARGIIYDELTGEVVFLPFKKFFNHGENSLPASSLPTTGIVQAEILEKLDGSMGAVWMDREGEVRVSTPGSLVSDQAIWGTQWLQAHGNYSKVRDSYQSGRVRGAVSEILFPGSQVVVQYDYGQVAGIHLTAAQLRRDSGKIQYASHEELASLSEEFDFGHCDIYDFESFETLRDHLREVDDFEGFVLHWPESGFRLKFKADEYIRLHRIISRIHPNRISEAIESNEAQAATSFDGVMSVVKDCIDAFPEEHRPPYETAYEILFEELRHIESTIPAQVELISDAHSAFVGNARQKMCAQDIKRDIDKKYHAYAFALLAGKTPRLSKVAMRIWKRIRKEIDWQGGDVAESSEE